MPPLPPTATKPGVIPLRPLGIGEILDGAISTMRAHPKLMLGVSAIVVTISQVLVLFATLPYLDDINRAVEFNENTSPDELWGFVGKSFAVLGITLMIVLISRVFLSGFLTIVVGKAVLGQPTAFGEVWERVRRKLLALLGLTMLYPLGAIVLAIPVVVLAILTPILGVLAAVGYIVVAIRLYVLFSLATPALVLENAPIRRAFGRSRQLVRGSWWRILGISLLAMIIGLIIGLIITAPFGYFGGGFDQLTSTEPVAPTTKYLALTTIGGIIASTITEPFVAAVTVLLYTDQRMRREGMDIELARAAGGPPM